MAGRADALAVDGAQVTPGPDRNAAIWFAPDGYDPKAKGINGRRVAGESFLRGFLKHADVPEFVTLAHNSGHFEALRAMAAEHRPGVPLRGVLLSEPSRIAPVGCINYPSPNFGAEVWRRAPYGASAWSICGITHTTSTQGVMQGFFDLRMTPQAEWDAVICTSRAVQASVLHQMDLIDTHICRRFGVAKAPPRPQLPVIPLGIHSGDFARDPAARAAFRTRIGAAGGDVVLTTIARLTPHEKFDPLPVYMALQQAQGVLGPGVRLHYALCGIFRDDYARKVFTEGAARLMPDVGFHLLDGAQAEDRSQALSGADIFAFLIDNIQETFGLAPIEGMAAGLPCLVSDWDGMRDTVTPEVGFRVTTRTLRADHTVREALRYQGGLDNYVQYCANVSALTQVDVPELVVRIVDLARNPDLRMRMGQAGQARARQVYDWAQVIPQMQDLWADLAARRRQAVQPSPRTAPQALPVAPSPLGLFAAYPTRQGAFGVERFCVTRVPGRPDPAAMLALRDYAGLKRVFEPVQTVAAVHAAMARAGEAGASRAELETATGLKALQLDRVMMWLLKYDFIRPVAIPGSPGLTP
jgi:glycosyltransferase involved in cell wall biosynthesis